MAKTEEKMKVNTETMFDNENPNAMEKMIEQMEKVGGEDGPKVNVGDVISKEDTEFLENTLTNLAEGKELQFKAKDVKSLQRIQVSLLKELGIKLPGAKKKKKKKRK